MPLEFLEKNQGLLKLSRFELIALVAMHAVISKRPYISASETASAAIEHAKELLEHIQLAKDVAYADRSRAKINEMVNDYEDC